MIQVYEATVEVTVRKKLVVSGELTSDQARALIENLGKPGSVSLGHFQKHAIQGHKLVPIEEVVSPVALLELAEVK